MILWGTRGEETLLFTGSWGMGALRYINHTPHKGTQPLAASYRFSRSFGRLRVAGQL